MSNIPPVLTTLTSLQAKIVWASTAKIDLTSPPGHDVGKINYI